MPKKKCTCEFCHEDFLTYPSRPGRFCSDLCRSIFASRQPRGHVKKPSRGGIVTWNCKNCGKEMSTFKSRVRDTCSKKCAYEYFKGVKNVTLVCKECGTEILVKPHKIKLLNQKFCSRACAGKANSKRMTKPDRNVGIYDRGPNWQKQSHAARERDNYTCQSCHKKGVSVHHIKKYKSFNGDWSKANGLKNLITLCPSCHSKIEHGKMKCPVPKS